MEKNKEPKALMSHNIELYASKEVKENALALEGKSCQPEIQKPQESSKRIMTSCVKQAAKITFA